jgi:hypothetical protein
MKKENKGKWEKIVSKLLKAELLKKEMTYSDLAKKLELINIFDTEVNIRNKFSRGTFSATFFVQCLRVIGVKNLELNDSFFTEN